MIAAQNVTHSNLTGSAFHPMAVLTQPFLFDLVGLYALVD
jgi:hypothetical protein